MTGRSVRSIPRHLRTLRSRSLKKLQLIGTHVETDEETTTLAGLLELWPDCVIVNTDGVRVSK